MSKELELWQFIASRLQNGEPVMLLVVAASSGSSPGRRGYKMAVAADGRLCGSIGGGVMEVRLVEESRAILSKMDPIAAAFPGVELKEQVHQKRSPNASGMICSGKQTVIFKGLEPDNATVVEAVISDLNKTGHERILITPHEFSIAPSSDLDDYIFAKFSETDFLYQERLGPKNDLYIVGGGHCALALSELMSKMDFHIRIFDDRPDLNTIDKNRFADEITIIESYENMGETIPDGSNVYVVVMTLGYRSDEMVIRSLLNKDLKYFGVLGSKAKMKTLLGALAKEGVSTKNLQRIHAPIGIPIKSHTPEEIAVSIAAEIIAVKNA
ncbi:MAG: XdhC family protein [Acidobacteriota bacterium]